MKFSEITDENRKKEETIGFIVLSFISAGALLVISYYIYQCCQACKSTRASFSRKEDEDFSAEIKSMSMYASVPMSDMNAETVAETAGNKNPSEEVKRTTSGNLTRTASKSNTDRNGLPSTGGWNEQDTGNFQQHNARTTESSTYHIDDVVSPVINQLQESTPMLRHDALHRMSQTRRPSHFSGMEENLEAVHMGDLECYYPHGPAVIPTQMRRVSFPNTGDFLAPLVYQPQEAAPIGYPPVRRVSQAMRPSCVMPFEEGIEATQVVNLERFKPKGPAASRAAPGAALKKNKDAEGGQSKKQEKKVRQAADKNVQKQNKANKAALAKPGGKPQQDSKKGAKLDKKGDREPKMDENERRRQDIQAVKDEMKKEMGEIKRKELLEQQRRMDDTIKKRQEGEIKRLERAKAKHIQMFKEQLETKLKGEGKTLKKGQDMIKNALLRKGNEEKTKLLKEGKEKEKRTKPEDKKRKPQLAEASKKAVKKKNQH